MASQTLACGRRFLSSLKLLMWVRRKVAEPSRPGSVAVTGKVEDGELVATFEDLQRVTPLGRGCRHTRQDLKNYLPKR
jgi:hypothetical protein